MSSMVLWRDAVVDVTASWHKGGTYTSEQFNGRTSRHGSAALAIRAAKRLADNAHREAARDIKVCLPKGWEMWHRLAIRDQHGRTPRWARDRFYILDTRTDVRCGGDTPADAVATLKSFYDAPCDTPTDIILSA